MSIQSTGLAAAFLDRWNGPRPAENTLEASLAGALAQARAAWPGVDLDGQAFAAHLGERAPAAGSAAEGLAKLHADDLYLACACGQGVPRAIETFEESFLSRLPGYLKRFALAPPALDEVRQRLREKLFVARPAGVPRILAYDGRGALSSWLRVVAIRMALDSQIVPDPRIPSSPVELGYATDPELEAIRARCRGEFESAFRDAFAGLTAKERNLLRLHFRDGVAMGRIASVYGTHRTTVLRWIAAAQENLLAELRRHLTGRLRISASECDSLLGVLRSRANLTLHRLLRDSQPPGG